MKKKIAIAAVSLMVVAGIFGAVFNAKAEIVPEGPKPNTDYYQCMRYCGSSIKRACTSETLVYPCTSYYCLVDY